MEYQLLVVLACLAGVCYAVEDMPTWEIIVNDESRGAGPVYVNNGDKVVMKCTTADPSTGFIVNKQQRLNFKSGKSNEPFSLAVQGTIEQKYKDKGAEYSFDYNGPIISTFTINSITDEFDGQFFCEVWTNRGSNYDQRAETEVIILADVDQIEMKLASQVITGDNPETTINLRPAEYQVSCEVSGSNPPPVIKMMLGDEELKSEYKPALDPENAFDRRSFRAMMTVTFDFNYDNFGKKLSCRAEVPAGNEQFLTGKEISVTLQGITDQPQVACSNNSAAVNDRKVTLNCILSSEPKVKHVSFNLGNEVIYPGNTTENMVEVYKEKLNSTHEQVTLKFYMVKHRHFDENIYLDVRGYDGKVHQFPVFLKKDVSGATKATVFVPLVCLIALLRLL